ncbi:MAG: tetratricopeptide repeat protein [Candidatus Odinarchaeota archaeon]
MSKAEIMSEVMGLAVSWDEVQGPTIISEMPSQTLNDPINISLQIYMASVTIFGQMKEMTRVEITIPILSISADHVVRVAFDSWPDPGVRGNNRPCYIAFIMEKSTAKKLDDFLGKAIWTYIDEFKEKKTDYSIKSAWNEIQAQLKGDAKAAGDILTRARQEMDGYSYSEAMEDLKNASDLWETARDRNALWFAVKSAVRLEMQDQANAGRGFFLAAAIHVGTGNNEDARDYFLKAVDCFKNAGDQEAAADSLFNAAISAFRLENYQDARDHLFSSVELTNDAEKKGKMFLYLALSLDHLAEYDESAQYFKAAITSTKQSADLKFAARIASTYAFRLNERAVKEPEGSSKNELFEQSAMQRREAAGFFREAANFNEAASSFTLASKTYLQAENPEMAAKSLEEAAEMFIQKQDYQSASKSLLDIATFLPSEKGLVNYLLKAEELAKRIEKIDMRGLLLTVVYRRMARAYETLQDYKKAREAYLKGHDHAQDSGNDLEVASVSLSLANISFNLEDYNSAGTYFLEAAEKLRTMGEDKQPQVEKCIKNAYVSFRRASLGYKQAGNVAIFEGDETRAIGLYEMSIDLLALAKQQEEVNQQELSVAIKQEMNSLILKQSLFEREQERLMALIARIRELI